MNAPGATFRPLRPGDREELLSLWNAAAEFDPMSPGLLDEKVWGDPGFDPDLAQVLESGGRIVAFGMGVIRPTAEGLRGVVKLLAVDPGHRRRGVGSALLDTLESRICDRGARTARVCESPPNYLCPGVDERYSMALPFFERAGYRVIGTAFNMTARLEGLALGAAENEAALRSRGVECRRAGARDSGMIGRLLEAHWPPWRDEVDAGLAHEPPSVHVAIRDGEALGFAAWDTNNLGTGWFGPMGTAPAARGLGIGRFLLHRCLCDMREAGYARAEIPWVEPRGFYEQHAGAKLSRRFTRFEKDLVT